MAKILDFIKRLGFGKRQEQLSAADVEELRAAFKARYHNFKLLLSANNKALEVMTDLEQALRGSRPFGMSFIRANCTAVSVNVFRIVKSLDQLAPGKYQELYDRFKDIQDQTNEVLSRRRLPKGDRLVIPLAMIDKDMADQFGSKMANVGEVKNQLHLPVPEGFVITSLAYERFNESNQLQAEIDRRLQSTAVEELDEVYALSADIQQLIIRSTVPEDLEREIMEAYRQVESAVHLWRFMVHLLWRQSLMEREFLQPQASFLRKADPAAGKALASIFAHIGPSVTFSLFVWLVLV